MMNSYSSFLDSIFDFNFEDQLLGQHSILLGTQVIKGFFFFFQFIYFIYYTHRHSIIQLLIPNTRYWPSQSKKIVKPPNFTGIKSNSQNISQDFMSPLTGTGAVFPVLFSRQMKYQKLWVAFLFFYMSN